MTEPPARLSAAGFEDKLAALRAAYRRALPEQLDALATVLEAAGGNGDVNAVEAAWRLAHRLKGTSGSYGFSELSAELETIEEILERPRRMRSEVNADERARAVAALSRARAWLA